MTNFQSIKPNINTSDKKIALPKKPQDKQKAIEEAVKIIRENQKIVKAASKSSHENFN